jgi:hypothetical protein
MQAICRLTIVALVLAGCASSGASDTAPEPEAVSRVSFEGGAVVEMHNAPGVGARDMPAPIDSVWMALPRVYEMLGIPDVGAEPTQRIYGSMDFRARRIEGKRLSTYIDCGMGTTAVPNADDYQVTMSVLTRLTPGQDNGTMAITTVRATARPRATNRNPVSCQSKGTLESRVADLVMYVLLGGRGNGA